MSFRVSLCAAESPGYDSAMTDVPRKPRPRKSAPKPPLAAPANNPASRLL